MRFGVRLMAALAALLVFTTAPVATAGPPQPATADEIATMIAEAGTADDYDGAAFVYLLDEADVYVQDSGLATTESCQVIKILTEAGIKRQSMQRFDFDPATRRVTVKSIRVHREDGTIDDVSVDAQVTQPTEQAIIFWGGQQHLIGVPNLQVGDTLEIRVSKIGFNIAYLGDNGAGQTASGHEETLQPPMPGHWYEVTLFQGNAPIERKRYAVHMPKDKPLQYEVYNGPIRSSLWFADDHHVYTFTAEDIPAVKREPHMVALDDCVPKVVMATVADWETKSRWFFAVNETQFDADEDIQATVKEITKGLTKIEDKIAACNHWVADNIRYYGTSRGPCEGFTLHRGIETYRDKGGVCKDKAGMLVTMLRVLGVEAYAALTMAGSRVEAIPADQFNHTVTVYRNDDGKFVILDPTWIPQSREMWSSREALQGLVYGTEEGESLTLSPYYPPSYNQLVAEAESKLDEDGTLKTSIAMKLKGYPCTYLRRYVGRYRPSEVHGAFESVLNIAPTAELLDVSYTDPFDYSEDSRVSLQVKAPDYAAGHMTHRLFKLPLMSHPLADWLLTDLVSYDFSADEREYGYRMRATRGLKYTEAIELPRGWNVVDLPEEQKIESPSADLTFAVRKTDTGLAYTFTFDLKNHTVPPEDYAKLKEALETMGEISDFWVVCERDDALAQSADAKEGGAL